MQNSMKRMVMVTALLLMMLSVQGQDARVAEMRKMYAEAKAHHLIFSYTNAKEEGEQHEWRYYFDENGKCIETKSNSDTKDGGKADKERVGKLVMIFQKLTN